MSAVLFVMIAAGTAFAACTGRLDAVSAAALAAGRDACETAFSLIGGFMLFGGLIGVLQRAGAVRFLVRCLRRPLRWLFGKGAAEEALEAVSLNLAANMLGLSNAATPMGMRAAKLLTKEGERQPSAALCLLLVINATSVQLLPASVIALRAAAGSSAPGVIVWPSLAASAVSTLVGVTLCRLIERKGRAA